MRHHCPLRHDIDCKPARWWEQLCVDREVRLNISLAVDRMTSVKGWKSLPCIQISVDWDLGDIVNQIYTSRSRQTKQRTGGKDIELLGSRRGLQETRYAPVHLRYLIPPYDTERQVYCSSWGQVA